MFAGGECNTRGEKKVLSDLKIMDLDTCSWSRPPRLAYCQRAASSAGHGNQHLSVPDAQRKGKEVLLHGESRKGIEEVSSEFEDVVSVGSIPTSPARPLRSVQGTHASCITNFAFFSVE